MGDGSLIYCFLLQQLSVAIPFQYLHLLNGKYFFFPFEKFYVAGLGTAVPSLAT